MDQLDRTKILQTLALKDTSLQPEIPTDLKPEHYNPKPDAHFNNEGMKVYAAHLAALINGKRKRR